MIHGVSTVQRTAASVTVRNPPPMAVVYRAPQWIYISGIPLSKGPCFRTTFQLHIQVPDIGSFSAQWSAAIVVGQCPQISILFQHIPNRTYNREPFVTVIVVFTLLIVVLMVISLWKFNIAMDSHLFPDGLPSSGMAFRWA